MSNRSDTVTSQPVLVIAEAGVNHNGSLERAKELVLAAKSAGADIVKFQTFKAERLVTKSAQMADYQIENLGDSAGVTQFAMLKDLELSEDDFRKLARFSAENGIRFFSTGFDLESLRFLTEFNAGIWKIPSGEITNLPYLEFIGEQSGDIVLSTGMAYLSEVRDAVEVLTRRGVGRERLTVLHCNTEYPTPFTDVHLRAMATMQKELGVRIGYSDHTMGIEVPIAAVAMGATVIEKHFTLDRNLPGPDHRASLEPAELSAMVKAIRNIEAALGRAEKSPSASEEKNRAIARKSIVAKRGIRRGEILSDESLTTKRPGTGVSPMNWHQVIGTPAQRDFAEDELITI